MKQETIEKIKAEKLIAIVRGVKKEQILPLAEALYQGGIRLMEVTFNQKNPDCLTETSEMISLLAKESPMCVGAGTVMNPQQCDSACEAGAKYIISPHLSLAVLEQCQKNAVVSIPGVLTPTEAVTAYENGADFVKLFPAGDLGCGYIKSMTAPLNHIPFLAVGGINCENIKDFMGTGIQGVGVGGNLVNLSALAVNDYSLITKTAKEYTQASRQTHERAK